MMEQQGESSRKGCIMTRSRVVPPRPSMRVDGRIVEYALQAL